MKKKAAIWAIAIIFLAVAIYLSFYEKKYDGKEVFSEDFKIDKTSFLVWNSTEKSPKKLSNQDAVNLLDLLKKAKYKHLANKKSHGGFKLRYEMTARENDKNFIIEIYDNGVLQLYDFDTDKNYWYSIYEGFNEILEFIK